MSERTAEERTRDAMAVATARPEMEYCNACSLPFWVAITPRADGHKRGPCKCPEYDPYEE